MGFVFKVEMAECNSSQPGSPHISKITLYLSKQESRAEYKSIPLKCIYRFIVLSKT